MCLGSAPLLRHRDYLGLKVSVTVSPRVRLALTKKRKFQPRTDEHSTLEAKGLRVRLFYHQKSYGT